LLQCRADIWGAKQGWFVVPRSRVALPPEGGTTNVVAKQGCGKFCRSFLWNRAACRGVQQAGQLYRGRSVSGRECDWRRWPRARFGIGCVFWHPSGVRIGWVADRGSALRFDPRL